MVWALKDPLSLIWTSQNNLSEMLGKICTSGRLPIAEVLLDILEYMPKSPRGLNVLATKSICFVV